MSREAAGQIWVVVFGMMMFFSCVMFGVESWWFVAPIGLVVLMIWNATEPKEEAPVAAPVSEMATKQCPYCAEDIKAAAIVCKHCGREVPQL